MATYNIGDKVTLRQPGSCCGTTIDMTTWTITDKGRFRSEDGSIGPTIYGLTNSLDDIFVVSAQIRGVPNESQRAVG